MDTTGNFPKAGGAAADKAAGAVKDGISTAQQGLVQAASAAAGKVDQWRDEAAPAPDCDRKNAVIPGISPPPGNAAKSCHRVDMRPN